VLRLRAKEPVPERPSLRAELLLAYAREFRPQSSLARARRAALVLSAAALVIAACLLGARDWHPADRVAPRGAADLARLELRIDLLQARLLVPPRPPTAAFQPAQPAQPEPAEEWSSQVRLLALADRDPALFRLVSARTFETIDRQAAAGRYRQLLNDYAGGPAADVARDRLAFLNQ
jgi:hypothetical protein